MITRSHDHVNGITSCDHANGITTGKEVSSHVTKHAIFPSQKIVTFVYEIIKPKIYMYIHWIYFIYWPGHHYYIKTTFLLIVLPIP